MRSLKNWYVNFGSIKSSNKQYQEYLLSSKRHPNENISQISEDTILDLEIDLMKYNDKRTGRGQKAKQNGYEIVVGFPFDLDDDDFKSLYESFLSNMYEDMLKEQEVPEKYHKTIIKRLIERVYCVKHKNNHIHLITPTKFYSKDLQITFDLSKKKTAYKTKENINNWLEANKNISKYDYVVPQFTPKNQSRKRIINSRNKKLSNNLEIATKQYEEMNKLIKEAIDKKAISENDVKKIHKTMETAKQQIANGNDQRAMKTVKKVSAMMKR